MGSQPFDEQPVALRLNCRWLPHVEIGVRVTKGELPVRVSRDHVAEDQPEPDGLELRQPGSLIEKVRYEQVGVDDRLGDHPGHGCGAHVRKGQSVPTARVTRSRTRVNASVHRGS